MSGPPLTPIYYPFAAVPSSSNSNVFPFDIIINENFPGVIFDPTEAGGVYSVIREVSGCLWYVLNADFDQNTLSWTQEDPTNPNLPAYAMEMCSTTASWAWLYGAPTLVPGNPITWVNVFTIDDNGSVISVPRPVLASGDPAQQINPTWNAGSASHLVGRQLSVIDSSSSVTSVLDNLAVNGTAVWTVNKFGLLVTGQVPTSAIPGLYANPTFTGTSTFTGPVIMNSTLHVIGATTLSGGIVGGLSVASGLSVTSGGLGVTGGETVSGGSAITGGLTADTLHTTSTATVDGALTANSTLFVSGLSQMSNATVTGTITQNGTTPVVPLTSSDSSIITTQVGTNSYDLELRAYPIGSTQMGFTTSSPFTFTIPNHGNSWISSVILYADITPGVGTIVLHGAGGTAGGNWAGTSQTVTNPNSNHIAVSFVGSVNPNDTLTATVSVTGAVVLGAITMIETSSRLT